MPSLNSIFGPPPSSSIGAIMFDMPTTVDDLSYVPPGQEQSRESVDSAVEAYAWRTWKLKKRDEAFWPPMLEAILIEALEKYHESSRTQLDNTLGRIPMRNRFISDYIFQTTGKRKTPKQVGSRLQQLRDTCKEEKNSFFPYELVRMLDPKNRSVFDSLGGIDEQLQSAKLLSSVIVHNDISGHALNPPANPADQYLGNTMKVDMFSKASNVSMRETEIVNAGGNVTINHNHFYHPQSFWDHIPTFSPSSIAEKVKKVFPGRFWSSHEENSEEVLHDQEDASYPPLWNAQIIKKRISMCMPGFAPKILMSIRYSFF